MYDRGVQRGFVALSAVALALVVAGQATATTTRAPTRYAFSFAVALKPYHVQGVSAVRVTGAGTGSFSIKNRRIDRDGTPYWTIVHASGRIALSVAGNVLVRATVVGGTFGIDGDIRSVSLTLRVATIANRLHCSSPHAMIEMDYHPLTTRGDTYDLVFGACMSQLNWDGRPPALVVSVKPT